MTNKMTKFVEQLKDAHKKEEIWIIGTGKSLDDFPLDFFDNKISIAMNGAIWKYENCTYWLGHHEFWRLYLRDEKPELLGKCIIGYPFPGPFEKDRILNPEEFFLELTSEPYWLNYANAGIFNESIAKASLKIITGMEKNIRMSFHAIQSVIHLAIQVAFLMGAKKIVLAGCENEKFNNLSSHAELGRKYPGAPYIGIYKKMPAVDKANKDLAKALKEYDVELKKYFNKTTLYYEKGYQEI